MGYSQKETAVLYFTRSADEEARAKTFYTSGNFVQNKAIVQRLIVHTYKQIKVSGLPVKVFNSEIQRGHSFGEKLGNAFQSLFDEGYKKVIALGNDCPQLSTENIKCAASLLDDKHLVAGPALDGGLYLIGINRCAYNKQAFCNLAWKTDGLIYDFTRYATINNYDLTYLGASGDIDSEEGLWALLRNPYCTFLDYKLLILLLSILSSAICGYQNRIEIHSYQERFRPFYRGPPTS